MKTRHPLVLIAAVAQNGIIGRAGGMPWRLPGDLAHFREATVGRPLLMGRNTFQAIGRPLPDRTTIVISSDPGFAPDGVIACRSIDDALAEADRMADQLGADRIMVGGGGALYRALMPAADALLITAVEVTPAGDTSFPPIDAALWERVERRGPTQGPADTAPYRIERWERRPSLLQTRNKS